MAVVIEGVGKVKPDDALEGKTDGQLKTIIRTLKKRNKLTKSQQSVLKNAEKMQDARDKFRRENNYRGGNLTTATLNELRSGSRKDVAKFIAKLKQRQKAARAAKKARKNVGEPF